MNLELLDNQLNDFFENEARKGDVSNEKWQELISHAVTNRQNRPQKWVWNPLRFASVRSLAAATAVVVTVLLISEIWLINPSNPGPGIPSDPGAPGNPGVAGVPGAPGSPSPRYFVRDWSIDKKTYIPGEPIDLTLTLTSVHPQPLKFREVSVTPNLPHLGMPHEVPTPDSLDITGDLPEMIQTGEKLEIPITLPSSITSNFATGRYNVYLDLKLIRQNGDPEPDSWIHLGMNSGILFVVLPPEGALIETMQLGEVRQASGITMTLASLTFAAEETRIAVVIALPDGSATETGENSSRNPAPAAPAPAATRAPASTPASADTQPAPADTPAPAATRTPEPASTTVGSDPDHNDPSVPHATATPAPPEPGAYLRGTIGIFQIDGGVIEELRVSSVSGSPEAVYLEWIMGPVSKTTRTFDFFIDEIYLIPGEEIDGSWRWEISLQDE